MKDADLSNPAANELIPEDEPGEGLDLRAEIEAGQPAHKDEDENELIPPSPAQAQREAMLARIEGELVANLDADLDLGGGAILSRAASGKIAVTKNGRIVVLERASLGLLEKIARQLDR